MYSNINKQRMLEIAGVKSDEKTLTENEDMLATAKKGIYTALNYLDTGKTDSAKYVLQQVLSRFASDSEEKKQILNRKEPPRRQDI